MNTESNFKGKTNYLPMLSERDVAWCRGVCLWSQLFWKSGEEWWWLWHPVTSIWEGKKRQEKKKENQKQTQYAVPTGALLIAVPYSHTVNISDPLTQPDERFGTWQTHKMCVLIGWRWHTFPLYPVILVPTLHLSVQWPSNPPILYAVALRPEALPLLQIMEFSSSSFHLRNETVSPGYSIWRVWEAQRSRQLHIYWVSLLIPPERPFMPLYSQHMTIHSSSPPPNSLLIMC